MVAMLIGCGLRRAELQALSIESIQQREEHWSTHSAAEDATEVVSMQATTTIPTRTQNGILMAATVAHMIVRGHATIQRFDGNWVAVLHRG